MELSPEERTLFVEIGHHIARVMWQNLGRSDLTYQTEMWDCAESVYEHGCAIMENLGVFRRESPSLYRFAMPLENVRTHLEGFHGDSFYDLDRIVGIFLWATAGYQGDVSDQRAPFDVPGHLQQAMWAFVAMEYARREPEGFVWTDKIAPIMIAECLWTAEGESFSTLAVRDSEDLTERIWTAIPVWRRHLLARWIVGKSEAELMVHLFRRWDGKRFRLTERPKGKGNWIHMPTGYDFAVRQIAERLVAIRRSHPF